MTLSNIIVEYALAAVQEDPALRPVLAEAADGRRYLDFSGGKSVRIGLPDNDYDFILEVPAGARTLISAQTVTTSLTVTQDFSRLTVSDDTLSLGDGGSTPVYGRTISIDTGRGGTLSSSDVAGVQAVAEWQEASGFPDFSISSANDVLGVSQTIGLQTTQTGAGNSTTTATDDGSNGYKLFRRALRTGNVDLSITGAPYAKFDVILYLCDGIVYDGQQYDGNWNGAYVEDVNYTRVEGLTADTTLAFTFGSGGFATGGLAGFQIVERLD